VPRVSEDSEQEPGDVEGDGVSTDKVFEPPEHVEEESGPTASPSTPESTNTVPAETRDRGRSIALGTLGALVALGAVLIVRGPQAPAAAASSPAAVLTSAELPPPAAGSASAPAPAPEAKAAQADAGPKFVPVWRVSALEHDPAIEIVQGKLGKHTLAGSLAQAGIARLEQRRITHAVDGIRRVERGVSTDSFVVARDRAKGTIVAFEYITSPTDIWQAKTDEVSAAAGEHRLIIKKLELFVEKKRSTAALVVTTDLAKAIAAANVREEAINEIADAFEGHGDAAIIKPGVRLRLVGHEEWVEGAFAKFHVDAVDYVPKAGNALRVYFYERDSSVEGRRRSTPHPGFYDAKGQQPFRGTFRSPLPTARITSRFNPKRMHPVLHVVMPHNGIDFGASSGTPVFASASGTVHSAGDGGPCGNMVQIEHSNGLTTAYCHLSRFAAGLHSGQHVEARQLVGYVGQTGRATGPHLHFAVKRGGNFIDPQALKMDGVRTLPPVDREVFAKRRAELDAALDAIALPSADGVVVTDDKDDKDEPAGEE
jgi:murein DD-endopeptidase MepM/ murein hydrolase activator NlpD